MIVRRSQQIGTYPPRIIAAIEILERRQLLSGTLPTALSDIAYLNPSYTVLKKNMATPYGYSDPNGAPTTPAKMRGAYGMGSISFNGVTGDGTGQTIGIVEAGSDPNIASDLASFDTYWGLQAPPSFLQLNSSGNATPLPGVNSGVVGELALDVEWAHVMAPNASLILFEDSNNLYNAISEAAKYPGVSAVSISYGISPTTSDSFYYTPTGHAGVTFAASTGDTGGEVGGPADAASVVAVGGTSLYTSGNSYSSESAWSAGGGGINTADAQPSYQSGVVSAWSTTNRTTPDVSLDANPSTGVAVYDTYNNGTSSPWSEIVGGTSLSAPLFAGIVAVVDQGRVAAGQTTLDGYTQTLPRMYKLAGSDYHDITSGNNTHPATTGYDLASGIGSPVGNKFIPDLAGVDTITGRAFVDTNGDQIYNGSDTVLSGKTVYLDLNNSGVQTASDPTAVTNSTGIYTFTDQIGSETGVVRLVSPPAGQIHEVTAGSFTTSYDQTQAINIVFEANPYTAVASPSPVTGKTAALSLSGTNPPSASAFTYTWAATTMPTGAAPVFSVNGTNAAANTTVTFNKAGNYSFTVTINDGQGSTVTSTVSVTVNSTLSTIAVAPSSVTLNSGQSQTFSAVGYDQFGNALATQPSFTYSIDSGGFGSITAAGLYSDPVAGGGTAIVRATSGSISGTASVTDVLSVINGTSGNDTIQLVRSGANLNVFINSTSTPTYTVPYSSLNALTINTLAGTDTVNIDFSGGTTPVPTGGLTVNGASGPDTLTVTGTTVGDVGLVNANTITFDGSFIAYNNVNSIIINGNGGIDSLTQTAQPGATLVFNGATSGGPNAFDSLNISGGTFTFAAPNASSGVTAIPLSSLTIGSGASVVVNAAAARSVLVLTTLSLSPTGMLNLGGDDLILHNADAPTAAQSLASVTSLLASGYNAGSWNGTGISSSAAQKNAAHLTALGSTLSNGTAFDGQSTAITDLLIKYTYYGDANLSGQVSGSDYTLVDYGYLANATGWSSGDFNYDGIVDGSDYTLIDNAFNSQGATLASQIASPAAAVSKKLAVTATPFSAKSIGITKVATTASSVLLNLPVDRAATSPVALKTLSSVPISFQKLLTLSTATSQVKLNNGLWKPSI